MENYSCPCAEHGQPITTFSSSLHNDVADVVAFRNILSLVAPNLISAFIWGTFPQNRWVGFLRKITPSNRLYIAHVLTHLRTHVLKHAHAHRHISIRTHAGTHTNTHCIVISLVNYTISRQADSIEVCAQMECTSWFVIDSRHNR